jgi:hypothetical protein
VAVPTIVEVGELPNGDLFLLVEWRLNSFSEPFHVSDHAMRVDIQRVQTIRDEFSRVKIGDEWVPTVENINGEWVSNGVQGEQRSNFQHIEQFVDRAIRMILRYGKLVDEKGFTGSPKHTIPQRRSPDHRGLKQVAGRLHNMVVTDTEDDLNKRSRVRERKLRLPRSRRVA